jgi:FkbM family methyltransferase
VLKPTVEFLLPVGVDGESMSKIAEKGVVDFEYPKQTIVSYAQTHEDVLLWRALHAVGAGFYVDVGAHDPTHLSVTRAFYERNWRGINVEPNPEYARRLREKRPRDLTVEVALGDRPGQATIYDFGATGLSTMVKEIAAQHMAAGFQSTELQVPVTTLAAIMNDSGEQEIHFLKIDVEGYERQVLRGADFRRFRPWVVLIEAVRPTTSIPSFEAWEPLLLEARYQFAYFDGLNRFYVSDEHADLRRYFSVPVNIADPFRDYETVRLSLEAASLSSEAARLSTAVEALERNKMRHDVPLLGSDAYACDPRDAAGLLGIVETQATDLVRLRRALVAQKSLTAELRGGKIFREEVKISEWVGFIALSDLARTQACIAKLIEPSPWQQLGRRLGIAKQFEWTTGHWQSDLVKPNGGIVPEGASRAETPSVPELLSELMRLNGLLDDLRRCRWLQLGRRLGLAKSLPEEFALGRDSLLLEPFPDESAQYLSTKAKSKTPPSDHEGLIEHTNQTFLEQCRDFAVDAVLDVGANTGQFAQALRAEGYHGHIVSFEPLSDAHGALMVAAESDPLWDVAERCAIGARCGSAEINISGNSYSSSLLPMLDLHRDAAPQSEYLGKEPCQVVTLDSYIERTFSDPTTLFAAKIDTQGYEAEVLAGLKRHHDRVKVILCEMSVAPLYAHGPSMRELCHLLAELNYRCVALSPEFEDPRTGELLQTNGVFVKRD